MNAREQKELYQLLEKQMLRFTNGEGELESVELAQQLLMSMEYCMNSYFKALEDGEPYGFEKRKKTSTRKDHMEDMFEKGVIAITGCVQKCRDLWKKVQKNAINVDNYTYSHTVNEEIPQFFEQYQPRYQAHLNVVELQYPLALDVEDLCGIEYVYEYLYHLWMENEFVGCFDANVVNSLFHGYHKEAKDDVINFYEVTLQNALGCSLLGYGINSLFISKEDRNYLQAQLEGLSTARIQILCEEHVNQIFEQLHITSQDMITYAKEKVKEISKRIEKSLKQQNLSYLFLSFEENQIEEHASFEGTILTDEKLREVIDEMSQMRYLKDKLSLLQAEVHNLNDVKEVLTECFAGDECKHVFSLLTPSQKELLRMQTKNNLSFYGEESLLKEWERVLLEQEKDSEQEEKIVKEQAIISIDRMK